MEKQKWGDITTIGITQSDLISIEFYDPEQQNGTDYTTIFLTIEQAKIVSKLREIINERLCCTS